MRLMVRRNTSCASFGGFILLCSELLRHVYRYRVIFLADLGRPIDSDIFHVFNLSLQKVYLINVRQYSDDLH